MGFLIPVTRLSFFYMGRMLLPNVCTFPLFFFNVITKEMCLLLEMFTWGKGGCGWSGTASLLRVLGSIPSTYMAVYSLLGH